MNIKDNPRIKTIVSEKSSTSRNFSIDGHQGTVGIIPAFTRTICNDCNRIRITSTGTFKNCLFDDRERTKRRDETQCLSFQSDMILVSLL